MERERCDKQKEGVVMVSEDVSGGAVLGRRVIQSVPSLSLSLKMGSCRCGSGLLRHVHGPRPMHLPTLKIDVKLP